MEHMDEYQRNLLSVKLLEDGSAVESHTLWNFWRRTRVGYDNRKVEDLHPWRSHYPIQRTGVHAPKQPSRVGSRGLVRRRSQNCPEVDQPMALPNDHSTEDEVAGEVLEPRIRRYPDWIGLDGDFDPRHLRWASDYRDWQDIKVDLLGRLRRPLDVVQGWLRL